MDGVKETNGRVGPADSQFDPREDAPAVWKSWQLCKLTRWDSSRRSERRKSPVERWHGWYGSRGYRVAVEDSHKVSEYEVRPEHTQLYFMRRDTAQGERTSKNGLPVLGAFTNPS